MSNLQKKLGEAEWMNKELKHSIKEKNLQIKKLLNNIEKVEKVLKKKEIENRKLKMPQLSEED